MFIDKFLLHILFVESNHKTINVVLQKCVLGRSSFEGYNSDNRTNSIVWGGAEKKPNQWNIRHFGLLESEIIADHEETGVVTICWMSESEMASQSLRPSELAPSDFSIITPWLGSERMVLICEKLDFGSRCIILLQYAAVSFYRGWILQLAVCEWSPVVPSQLRVRADPLMSKEIGTFAK